MMNVLKRLFSSTPRFLARTAARHRTELSRLDEMEKELKRYRASVERQLQAVERELFVRSTGNPSRVYFTVDPGRRYGDRTAHVTVRLTESGQLQVVKLVTTEPGA